MTEGTADGRLVIENRINGTPTSDDAMRRLNYELDMRHRDEAAVAREFMAGLRRR